MGNTGKNKSRIFCNKNPILGKSGGGILPTSRRVFACAQNSSLWAVAGEDEGRGNILY